MKISALALATALVACLGSTAYADTITAGSSTTVAAGGIAPGSSSNYIFFGNNGQPSAQTNVTVSTSGDSMYPGNGGYTSVTAPGGSSAFTTGIAYHGGPTAVLATFTTTFSSFDVWILDGNTDGNNVGNVSVGLGVNNGAEVVSGATLYSGVNEFTEFTVTGASAGDTFQVYATGKGGNYASIGGLTFQAISATPEPSSLVLLGTGIVGMAGMMRRRMRKA